MPHKRILAILKWDEYLVMAEQKLAWIMKNILKLTYN